ncbi:cyanophycinase [Niveispirillum cyanobacteriorum]|uniref:Cyanophycinase n=1 Tax=Niveispirillum cyanobacteriorum TaxID=1612173 RepID=A0A2K9NBF5_9PROT|nr:cyanophycinase [Niveispirillum cyanobacteriorum]AUN30483.1 cyanophycinase [Niveispirillum cyanobacteriorum]GGE54176.1 cyanophycinase [Niveispirillum cyanobacteriorum]
MRRLVLCMLAILATALPAWTEQVKGSLLIAGGDFRLDNPGWPRLVDLAGGKGATILVLPTGSGDPVGSGGRIVEHLRGLGANAILLPLAEKGFDRPAADIVTDPVWIDRARHAGGFFLVGGDQSRYTAALLRADGTDTPLLAAIRTAHARGAVIAGSSAGAAIMSATMIKDAPETLDLLATGPIAGRTLGPGLGFIGPDWFVDQHFLARGRFARTLVAMDSAGYTRGLGVDENTAIIIRERKTAEVVGASGVVVIDTRTARRVPGWPFEQTGSVLSLLRDGDQMDLATGDVTPGSARADAPILPTSPGFEPDPELPATLATGDILAPWQFGRLMAQVLESRKGEATGLAFDAATPATRPAFRMLLTRNANSRGWAGDGITVLNLTIDITPVRMADPLFSPLRP